MSNRRNSAGAWLATHGLLLAGLWGFSMWAFPNLPDRIPMHFDFYGNPDRWVAGSSPEWFLVPGIATFLIALLVAIAIALPRLPLGIINLPNKERFLQLPRERQLAVLDKVAVMLLSLALLPSLLMFAVQVMIYRVAHGTMSAPSGVPILVITGIVLVAVALWTVHLSRAISRETSQHAASPPRDS